jgi:translation initiation factor 2B subunit (eIF-2B alpha/beta/delta family)
MRSNQLHHILGNKTSGSSELVQMLNSYLLSIGHNKSEIIKTISLATIKLGHFEAINSYLKELNSVLKAKSKPDLTLFLKRYSNRNTEIVKIIFTKLCRDFKNLRSLITLSHSGTLVGVLKLWHNENKNLKVVVCESRPKFEGILMAKELAGIGIKVELITDAMIGLYVSRVDAAMIGADIILSNGNIVNKVGSKALALLSKEFNKPFYVVTSKSKGSKKLIFKPKKENPNEVLKYRAKNLSISNIYFEEIEKKSITKIYTD